MKHKYKDQNMAICWSIKIQNKCLNKTGSKVEIFISNSNKQKLALPTVSMKQQQQTSTQKITVN